MGGPHPSSQGPPSLVGWRGPSAAPVQQQHAQRAPRIMENGALAPTAGLKRPLEGSDVPNGGVQGPGEGFLRIQMEYRGMRTVPHAARLVHSLQCRTDQLMRELPDMPQGP